MKAESARRGVTGKELAEALGRDKKYIYERFRFEKSFAVSDLDEIADALGITKDAIWESAQFEQRTQQAVAA